jgi:hypothetical protein
VLAIIDQRECSIALLEALANLAYAQNSAAALYFKAAITTTTGYGDLSAAKSTARKASVEVETAEHTLRADQTVLEQAQADVPLAEAVAAADQQVLLQAQDKLAKAITNLRAAETAPEQASLATSEAHAADSLVLQRKAELEQAQLNLDYDCPFSGYWSRGQDAARNRADPAMFSHVYQFDQRGVGRQSGQPVLGGFGFVGRPFDQ